MAARSSASITSHEGFERLTKCVICGEETEGEFSRVVIS
ncbi:MAG: hypothetical protein AVDCRST_MAG93-366 [uncultured Chloroflexia bacterium]|uniref:Uncharacterized protein n=1 Tax=uncultured Chloroflexia bacterium TaxID=1672391 RepID=A0A6J4HAJ0_9CHLR|nr:MAG: hypothetical protein AVDCRST_MAG93-366 [uncultured Chloroflexia bacterium]